MKNEEGAAVEAKSGKLQKVLFLTLTKSILSPLELVGSWPPLPHLFATFIMIERGSR